MDQRTYPYKVVIDGTVHQDDDFVTLIEIAQEKIRLGATSVRSFERDRGPGFGPGHWQETWYGYPAVAGETLDIREALDGS